MLGRLKKALLPLAVLAAGIGVVVVLNATKPPPEVAAEPPKAINVYTELAQRVTSQLSVETTGEVRATVRSELVAQVAGRVVQVSDEFVEGGRFDPGETLVTIEDTDYRASFNEAEARVAAAEVDLETALADADVARKQLQGVKNPSALALKKPQVSRARAVDDIQRIAGGGEFGAILQRLQIRFKGFGQIANHPVLGHQGFRDRKQHPAIHTGPSAGGRQSLARQRIKKGRLARGTASANRRYNGKIR